MLPMPTVSNERPLPPDAGRGRYNRERCPRVDFNFIEADFFHLFFNTMYTRFSSQLSLGIATMSRRKRACPPGNLLLFQESV